MHNALSLHQGLLQILSVLDQDQLRQTLSQLLADAKGESGDSLAMTVNILDRLGLRVEEVYGRDVCSQLKNNSAILAVGANSCVVVERGSNGKFTVSEWRNNAACKKYTSRTLPKYEGLTWLAVRNRGAFASMASPGGRLGAWERLFRFIRLERRDISAVMVYSATLGALTLVIPIATQALVNTIAFGAVLQPLIVLVTILFVGLGLAATLRILQAYLVEVIQRRIIINAAEDLGDRLPRVAEKALDRLDLIELNNRFLDVITIQKSAAELLLTGLALVLQTGVGFVLLGLYHPLLLVFTVVVVLGLALVALMGKGGTDSAILESKAKFSLAAWLDELARNPRRFMGGHGRMVAAQELAHRAHAYVKARRIHYRRILRLIIGGNLLQVLTFVGLLAIGGWLVIERQLTLGQLVAAELVVSGIAVGLGKFGKLADKTFDLIAALDKLGGLLDLPLEPLGKEILEESPEGMLVEVEDLQVAYGEDDLLPLTISFSLAPGEKALIEGRSSSGCSAVLEVVAGWRRSRGGSIRWNGHASLNADDFSHAVWILRKGSAVAGSIMTNLRLADAALSTDRAREALEIVGLKKVVGSLSNGLDTKLLPSGAPLSPFQLQRLMIAQVLIAKPRLLVVDRGLDGLEEEYDELLEAILGPEAAWTSIVTSCDPKVRGMTSKEFQIENLT